MASQTIFQKAANFAHKATITGLVRLLGIRGVQSNRAGDGGCIGTTTKSETAAHPQAGFIDTIREKAKEEYAKYYDIGHREWYDKEDDSYLKKLPRPGKDYQEK